MVDVVRILANVSTDDEMLRRQMLVLPPEEFQAWLQRRHTTLHSARADRVTIARPFATARQCASVGCDL
jgi:putative SOS response-associated peptidase YedK